MLHWVENIKDLATCTTDQLQTAKCELVVDVISIETCLGDRFKRHANGDEMTDKDFNGWRQKTKMALKFKKQALTRVKTELTRRASGNGTRRAKDILADLIQCGLDNTESYAKLLDEARALLK